MRFQLATVFSFSILIFFAQKPMAQAQADLESQILLRPSIDRSPQEAGLQSGRYQIKKTEEPTKPVKLPSKRVHSREVQDETSLQTSVIVTPQKDSQLAQVLFSGTKTSRPIDTATALGKKNTAKTEATTTATVVDNSNPGAKPEFPQPIAISEPAVFDTPAVEAYKEQVHSDDIRLNQLEINIAPGVIYDESKANYSFRSYSSFSPSIRFGAELWMSPFLGTYGNYMTSLGADVVGNAGTNSRIPAKHELTEIGLDIRKFFGMSRRANSVEFGVDYSEYKFTVPGDDTNRVKLSSTGFGFHLRARVPSAPTYAWVFGGNIMPRLSHSEIDTGLNLQSGESPETSRVGAFVGGEFKLSRQNQVVWDLNVSFEKNQYLGTANKVDPETGIAPTGVSVRNTFTSFSLGYRWGQ